MALEILRRMDQLDLNGLLLLGDVYHNLDLHSLSLDDYQEALQKQGNLSPDRFMRVAAILIDRGTYKAAFEYLERIEKKFAQGLSEKEDLRLLSLKAKVLLTTGQEARGGENPTRHSQQEPTRRQSAATAWAIGMEGGRSRYRRHKLRKSCQG